MDKREFSVISDTDTASDFSDTDSAPESEVHHGSHHDHGFYSNKKIENSDQQCSNIKEKISGNMSQTDFELLRSEQMEKVNAFEEQCKSCLKIFSSETEINIHLKRGKCFKKGVNKKGSVKNVTCTDCNRTFATRKKYINHCESHHYGKDHECHICGESFNVKRSWQRHKEEKHGSDKKNSNANFAILSSSLVQVAIEFLFLKYVVVL